MSKLLHNICTSSRSLEDSMRERIQQFLYNEAPFILAAFFRLSEKK